MLSILHRAIYFVLYGGLCTCCARGSDRESLNVNVSQVYYDSRPVWFLFTVFLFCFCFVVSLGTI